METFGRLLVVDINKDFGSQVDLVIYDAEESGMPIGRIYEIRCNPEMSQLAWYSNVFMGEVWSGCSDINSRIFRDKGSFILLGVYEKGWTHATKETTGRG